MKDYDEKFESIARKIAVQSAMQGGVDDAALSDLEKYTKDHLKEINLQIARIFTQMKIIRMVQQSIGGSPRKKKEDDPNYPEFNNFTRSKDEEALFEFLSLQGNKFDRDIQKLLNIFKRRSLSFDQEDNS